MTSVIFSAIAVASLAQVRALHRPQAASHDFLREANITVGASECEGRKQQWIKSPIKRLKGPVMHIHIPGPFHIVGNFLGDFARTHNGMCGKPYQRWDDLADAEVWKDGHWTDLEDSFIDHTLDDLGCGTFKSILSIAVRHPLNMVLHRWLGCQTQNKDICPNEVDTANCEPGSKPCLYDNNFVRVLAGKQIDFEGDKPADMTQADLELAKFRARQMDLIFIVEHLNETLQLGRTRLGWRDTHLEVEQHIAEEEANQKILESIAFQDWQLLKERNRLDIELFEYMRELSLDMLRADGLPEPAKELDEVAPQWVNTRLIMKPLPMWRYPIDPLRPFIDLRRA